MNRIIKFRAWTMSEIIPKHLRMFYRRQGDDDYGNIFELSEIAGSFNWILMQYTGLKDKRCRQIF